MRITGGIYRSRALRAPRGSETRPTSDRVREALFAILEGMAALDGSRVLDLYAGTGALSLEALSRGAESVVLVESSPAALAAIWANIATLGVSNEACVIASDVNRAGRRIIAEGPFDLVLADPPWALVESGDPQATLSRLVRAGALAGGACVVLEHASRSPRPLVEPMVQADTRVYGDTALTFFKIGILGAPDP